MNIGPMGNGLIDPKDMVILEGIGKWMDVNGESIHGAGRTPLPVQAWGESTRKGDFIYLHVFNWPKNGELVLAGLKSKVKKAWLLSDPGKKALPVKPSGNLDKVITVPVKAPDAVNTVVVVQVKREIETDARRLLSVTQQNRLHTFDGERVGERLKFGSGKSVNDYVYNWSKLNQSVRWNTRLAHAGTFDVYIEYSDVFDGPKGTFQIKVGSHVLKAKVIKTGTGKVSFKKYRLGTVCLSAGNCPTELLPVDIPGEELMRLRAVYLVPSDSKN